MSDISTMKDQLKTVSTVSLIGNAILETRMSFLEGFGRFLYPPVKLLPDDIFKVGMHAAWYSKVAFSGVLSATAGIGYTALDIRKYGLNRNNASLLVGHSFYALQGFSLYRAMAFSGHEFHALSIRASRYGGIADGIKAGHYLMQRDYKNALMYTLFSGGNFGMMVLMNPHATGWQKTLRPHLRMVPPWAMLAAGVAVWFMPGEWFNRR
ncbi:hypothetical protein ACFO3I_14290 [Rheinheimera marina]|uniref:DUF2306 domain-containing protein n=1 Tax=Rheinheimera marina TaxID=1774958 RepID=A0ABV9JPL5_9GAMM